MPKRVRAKIHKHTCSFCKKIFFSERNDSVYCNESCSGKGHKIFWRDKLNRGIRALRAQKTHGWGNMHRDNPEHPTAKWWRIRSPDGVMWEARNLFSWCRANETLFTPDPAPFSKTTLARRAFFGLSSHGQWYGWTLVTVFDIEKDPLDRVVEPVLPLSV